MNYHDWFEEKVTIFSWKEVRRRNNFLKRSGLKFWAIHIFQKKKANHLNNWYKGLSFNKRCIWFFSRLNCIILSGRSWFIIIKGWISIHYKLTFPVNWTFHSLKPNFRSQHLIINVDCPMSNKCQAMEQVAAVKHPTPITK
jgi:hypothetical protein